MLESDLFLGFPVDPLFQKKMDNADPKNIKIFIGSDAGLSRVDYEGMSYLGKKIKKMATLEELDLSEAHIFSLLKKIVPDHPYDETPLYLFPLNESL